MSGFAQQVARSSSAVQSMAAFPLRSSEKEEELYRQLQARERELEVARREQASLVRRLEEAAQQNEELGARLAAIESACRRLDIMRQVETHLLQRHYDGFLRKGKLKGRYDRLGNQSNAAPRNAIVYLWVVIAVLVVLGITAWIYNRSNG
jgi:chromosome segregation ATPase